MDIVSYILTLRINVVAYTSVGLNFGKLVVLVYKKDWNNTSMQEVTALSGSSKAALTCQVCY